MLRFGLKPRVFRPGLLTAQEQERSEAWSVGYADAFKTDEDLKLCGIYDNPYDRQTQPNDHTDYIAGYIAGKSARPHTGFCA